ncbi:MAG TPA: hypothetical protein VFW08_06210 [bacterium]|nr:hypothetical protein [bacterium]
MHPIGIVLAFLVFWSLVAAGAFLALSAGGRLRHLAVRRGAGEVMHLDAAAGVAVVLHVVTIALGAAMVGAGLYATYVVLLAP